LFSYLCPREDHRLPGRGCEASTEGAIPQGCWYSNICPSSCQLLNGFKKSLKIKWIHVHWTLPSPFSQPRGWVSAQAVSPAPLPSLPHRMGRSAHLHQNSKQPQVSREDEPKSGANRWDWSISPSIWHLDVGKTHQGLQHVCFGPAEGDRSP